MNKNLVTTLTFLLFLTLITVGTESLGVGHKYLENDTYYIPIEECDINHTFRMELQSETDTQIKFDLNSNSSEQLVFLESDIFNITGGERERFNVTISCPKRPRIGQVFNVEYSMRDIDLSDVEGQIATTASVGGDFFIEITGERNNYLSILMIVGILVLLGLIGYFLYMESKKDDKKNGVKIVFLFFYFFLIPTLVYSDNTDVNITVVEGIPAIYSYSSNDTYINFNESVSLTVNVSGGGFNISHVISEVVLGNSSITNFTLSGPLEGGNWSINFTKSDFGDNQSNVGLINITSIYSNNTDNIMTESSPSLTIDYARTLLEIKDSPDPAGNVSDSITFESDYETTENNDIELNCTLGIWYRTNGTLLNYDMDYRLTNHTITVDIKSWDLGGYGYNISCTNNSYQSKWKTGSFELINPSDYREHTSGGSGGGYEEEENVTGCGDGICQLDENYTICLEDCRNNFFYSPSEIVFEDVVTGKEHTGKIKIINPNNYTVTLNFTILETDNEGHRWAYFGPDFKTIEYTIQPNSTDYIDLYVYVPKDFEGFGLYNFNISITENKRKKPFILMSDIQIPKKSESWGLLENLYENINNESRVEFSEGRYLYLPPLFMGNYFSWRWIYVFLIIGIIILLVIIIKIISYLLSGDS